MADLNALIAQGAQFNLPNPVDQYSKVMQLQSAQQQMQLNRQQMQQIQEDRAGFAKLREKLADQNLTPEQYESALTQAPDPNLQKMGIELRMRRTRLDELDKALGGGVKPAAEAPMTAPVEAPMVAPFETSAQLIQTSKPYAEMSNAERIAFDISRIGNSQFGQPKAVYTLEGQEVPFSNYVNANIANSAGAGERAAMASMPNALAAQVAPAAAAEPVANAMLAQPAVGNAMASKQARIAQINKDLATLTKPQYYDLDGVKGRIANLDRELKQLTESPVGKVDLDKFDPASVAKFLDSGNFADLKRIETATGGRYLSLGAGKALDQDTGQIISADKVPAAAATPRIINIKGVPHTLNEEGNLEALPIEGAAPAVAVKAAPKITTIKGIPYTINLETGRLEPVPIEGGVLPAAAAQPQAAPKIINIKGVPHIFNVDKGKLERVPVEGGLPAVTSKGGAPSSAGRPKPPSGYRYDASGVNLEPIPGGPADKTKEGPAKEGGATEGERKAATLLQRLQFSESQLTEVLVNNPNAAKPGVFASAVAMLSTPLANSLTPEARQRVQSAQLDILDAALTLGTGAAYTREQLEGYRDAYFPQLGDKPNAIKDKQARLNNVISAAKIAAGKAAKLVPPAPAAAGGSSAMSEADKILNKDRK